MQIQHYILGNINLPSFLNKTVFQLWRVLTSKAIASNPGSHEGKQSVKLQSQNIRHVQEAIVFQVDLLTAGCFTPWKCDLYCRTAGNSSKIEQTKLVAHIYTHFWLYWLLTFAQYSLFYIVCICVFVCLCVRVCVVICTGRKDRTLNTGYTCMPCVCYQECVRYVYVYVPSMYLSVNFTVIKFSAFITLSN